MTEQQRTRVDLGYQPQPWQQQVHQAMARHRYVVIVAHRRSGKTETALHSLVLAALNKPGGRFAYVSPKLSQSKRVAWARLKEIAAKIPGTRVHEADLMVTLVNRSQISLHGGSEGHEESLRGVGLDGLVLDEVAGLAPTTWAQVLRPALSDKRGWMLAIGTPHGVDEFHRMYTDAVEDPEWYAGHFPVDVTRVPWLDEAELEAARKTMGLLGFEQEFNCSFTAAAEDALISIDVVEAAARRTHEIGAYAHAARVMGCDIARYGNDRTCLVTRQGLVCESVEIFEKLDLMHVAGLIAERLVYSRIDCAFVDVGGLGAGVVDRLRQMGHACVEVNFGGRSEDPHFADKRTEMWARMRDWLEGGGAIPPTPELRMDLLGPRYQFLANGSVRLEQKDRMRARGVRSPDAGDALALTFAIAHVMPRAILDSLPEVAEM